MENLKIDYKLDFKIVSIGFLVVAIFSYILLDVSISILIASSFFVFLFYLIVTKLEQRQYRKYSFSEEAIYIGDNKIPWLDLKIRLNSRSKNYFSFHIINLPNEDEVIIKYNVINSFTALTLKYCPKDHELYKLVEEYKKN